MLIGSSALQQTLVLVFCSVSVNGMASWFAKDYCLTPLEAGEVIMGDFATPWSSAQASITAPSLTQKMTTSSIPTAFKSASASL